jgi:hypothetical protein
VWQLWHTGTLQMEMETLSLGHIFQGHSQKILGTLFGHDGPESYHSPAWRWQVLCSEGWGPEEDIVQTIETICFLRTVSIGN